MAVFAEGVRAWRGVMESAEPVLVMVEAKVDGGTLRVGAQKVEDLDRIAANSAAGLRIALHDSRPIERLKGLLETSKRGRGKVMLVVGLAEGRGGEMTLPGAFTG